MINDPLAIKTQSNLVLTNWSHLSLNSFVAKTRFFDLLKMEVTVMNSSRSQSDTLI